MSDTKKWPNIWHGLFVAITTPFRGGQIEVEAFQAHIAHLLANGVDGLVVCGTTGEAATLDIDEQHLLFSTAVSTVEGRVPIVAGVGCNDTETTIVNGQAAMELGCTGLLVVTPYYNKPPQRGLLAHYEAVARATEAPLMVYNVPSRTCVDILPQTLGTLSQLDDIVAVKDATADMRVAAEIRSACGDRLNLLSGDDFSALGLLAVGGTGVVSVLGNVAPKRVSQMVHAALEDDFASARAINLELLPLLGLLFETTNPIPVKAAVSAIGFGTDEVHLPLVTASEELQGRLQKELGRLRLLPEST